MPPYTIQIEVFTNAFLPTTASKRLPRQPTRIDTVDFFWTILTGNTKVALWIQRGPTIHDASDPGNFPISSFQLPILGAKLEQKNVETICQPTPQGLDLLVFQVSASSATGAAIAQIQFND